MKKKFIAIFAGVISIHLVLISVIGITGGCRNPQALQKRNYITTPSVQGPGGEGAIIEEFSTPAKEEVVIEPLQPVTQMKTPQGEKAPAAAALSYKVQKGDSFWKIAKKYGVSMHELAAYNKLNLKSPLKVGQSLMIPPGGALAGSFKASPVNKKSVSSRKQKISSAGTLKKTSVPQDGLKYKVQKGDSLWKIAYKYNIKTSTLAKYNNITPSKPLKIGQEITIPSSAALASSAPLEEVKKPAKSTTTSAPAAANKATEEKPAPVDVKPKEDDLLKMLEEDGKKDSTDDLLKELGTVDSGKVETPKTEKPADLPKTAGIAKNDTVEVIEDTTIEDFSKNYGVKPEDVKKLNPGLPADGKLSAGMIIDLP